MDKLEKIFDLQNQFDLSLAERRSLDFTMEEWLQKQTLAMMSELSELLNEINYKWWKNPKQVQMDAVKEELVDVLHFFVGMCLKTGMTAEELFERYIEKNKENFARQDGVGRKDGYQIP